MKKFTVLDNAVQNFQESIDNMVKKLGSVEAACGYYTALLVRDHDLMETPQEIYKALYENALLA